jgi:hypothetical protein
MFKHYGDVLNVRAQLRDIRVAGLRRQPPPPAPPPDQPPSCFNETVDEHMLYSPIPFHMALDRASVEQWLPVATPDELRQRGWDGTVGAQ